MLYLDYAASTPVRSGALNILEQSMRDDFANPSSAHKFGKGLHERIESCREKFLEMMGAGMDDRLIFTASATESNNMLINGLGLEEGDSVIVSFAEHPSVLAPVRQLETKGVRVKELPLLPTGEVDNEGLFALLEGSVKLVILNHVNNQSGAITDICLLSREINKRNPAIHVHVDGAQGFGKVPFSLREGLIDSYSIASHKIGGPKGIAALYLRADVTVAPLLYGGNQENGLRSSTQAAPLIYSFFEAVREAMETIDDSWTYVTEINGLAREGLEERISEVQFPFSGYTSPYILTFLLPGISSDIILRHLEQRDIMISSTSACSSKEKGTSPVFTALHLPDKYHKFVLRVSFSYQTTSEEIETFCQTLADTYKELKQLMA
ncbi:MAG: cysteine desulfurase [bacterium]|nr:cysteine desulfurase [bacterium]